MDNSDGRTVVPDLGMIPTNQLLDEVMRRCSPAIFIGTKYEGDSGEREWKNFERWQGNLETCRGLCHEMDCNLQKAMIKELIDER